jgi:TPR repeat protein
MITIQSGKTDWKDKLGCGCRVHVRQLRGELSLAAFWLALWAVFAPFTAHPQTSATISQRSETPVSAAIQELIQRANGGDPKAQCDLGMIYAEGNGVSQDSATSVTWFRKAAEQDDANAQLRLGMSYLEGKGIEKNIDEAIKWLYKAAAHGPGNPNNPAQAVAKGTFIKKLVTLDGQAFNYARVMKAEPDGILITYKTDEGGFGMAKLEFKRLPGDIQKACGYDAQAEAAFATQQLAMEEIRFAEATKTLTERSAKSSEFIATLTGIVSDYHKTHTYLTNATGDSIYVCGDMACDVWNMVISKGINARIVVGDVKEDITSVAQAKHAWVLAEISDGEWLALEATGGYVVRLNENKKYFFGCSFSTPKEYRDFEHMKRQFNDALLKGRGAEDSYNKLVAEYNGADKNGKVSLKDLLQQQAGVLNDRVSELTQLKTGMDTFRLTGN